MQLSLNFGSFVSTLTIHTQTAYLALQSVLNYLMDQDYRMTSELRSYHQQVGAATIPFKE